MGERETERDRGRQRVGEREGERESLITGCEFSSWKKTRQLEVRSHWF